MAICTRKGSKLSPARAVPLPLTKNVESRMTRVESCSRALEICHLKARRRVAGSTPTATSHRYISKKPRTDDHVPANSLMTPPVGLPSRTWTFTRMISVVSSGIRDGRCEQEKSVRCSKAVVQRMTYSCKEIVQLSSARSVLLHGLLEDPLILSPVRHQLWVPITSATHTNRGGTEFAPQSVGNIRGSSYGLCRMR
jgi:hypothetical protein